MSDWTTEDTRNALIEACNIAPAWAQREVSTEEVANRMECSTSTALKRLKAALEAGAIHGRKLGRAWEWSEATASEATTSQEEPSQELSGKGGASGPPRGRGHSMARRKFTPRKVTHHAVSIYAVLHCPSCGIEVNMLPTECGSSEEKVGACCGHTFRTEVRQVAVITRPKRPADEVRRFLRDYVDSNCYLSEQYPDLFTKDDDPT